MLLNNFFYLFIIGAVIGSFLNVCIYRLPKNLDIISKRSFCPRCKKKIKWFDNIPLISIFILKFKCRFCKKSISIQYFLVELVSAVYLCLTLLFISNLIDLILLSLILTVFQIGFGVQVREFVDIQTDYLGLENKSNWLLKAPILFYIHRSFSLVVLA